MENETLKELCEQICSRVKGRYIEIQNTPTCQDGSLSIDCEKLKVHLYQYSIIKKLWYRLLCALRWLDDGNLNSESGKLVTTFLFWVVENSDRIIRASYESNLCDTDKTGKTIGAIILSDIPEIFPEEILLRNDNRHFLRTKFT